MKTLFRQVLIYDDQAPRGMTGPTDLVVENGRIAALGDQNHQPVEGFDEIIEGRGRYLVLPGLINAHYHSPVNHLKGSLPSLPLELFMLYESPSDPELTPTPREAYLRTMLGALEMLRTGTTSVQDDAFLMPFPTPEIIDAVLQAYRDSGIRATVGLDQPELAEIEKLPYIGEGASPSLMAALQTPGAMDQEGLLEQYDYLFRTWHGAEGGRLQAAASISAPQRVSAEYFRALDDLSRRYGVPLFAHMLETRVQRALVDHPRFAGKSLVAYTDDLGLLNERTNVIHSIWVDDDDLGRIARAGSTIIHNPNSNLRLGSGVAPYRRMMDFDIPVALGLDEAICDDSANLWGVVKTGGLIHNVTGLDSDLWPTAREVLRSLWSGGARAMLKETELGRIQPGFQADLTVVDLHTHAFTPLNDLPGQLVYCENGSSVRLTMVAGRVVYRDGVILTVDEPALLEEAREVFERKRPTVELARARGAELHPSYQAMVRRAAQRPLAFQRTAQGPSSGSGD